MKFAYCFIAIRRSNSKVDNKKQEIFVLVEGRVADSLLKAAESGKMLIMNHRTKQVRNVINVGRIRKAPKAKEK